MKTDSRLAINLQKSFRAASAAFLGILFCGALPAMAQSALIVLPYTINTIAGTGSSGAITPGPATTSEISNDLRGLAVDAQGDVYIADATNNAIEEINAKTGLISIVAGGGTICANHTDEAGDGCLAATQTVLNKPRGLALDKAGNLYIADYGHSLVEEVNKQTGMMTRVAGAVANKGDGGTKSYSGDNGQANVAAVNEPRGVRVDNYGNIWICDTGNNVIREVDAITGIITTVAGSNSNGTSASTGAFAGDGDVANSANVELNEPTDIVFDKSNNAYIVDFNNKVIREVSASTGIINTIIGQNSGTASSTAPVGPQVANTFPLGSPTKIDIDSDGNLYFSDSGESVIYFYDAAAKTITSIAGEYGYAGTAAGFTICANNTDTLGDGCPATQSLFYQGTSALALAIDSKNNLYITDSADERIREVSTNLNFPAESIGSTATQTVLLHFGINDVPATTNGIVISSTPGDFSQSASSCAANGDATTNCTLSVSFNPVAPGSRATPLVANGVLSHGSFPLTGVGNGVVSTIDPGTTSLLGTSLSASHGAALDAAGNLYVADTSNNRVVEISGGTQTVFAGTSASGSGGNGGLATAATLKAPTAVTIGPDGTVYIADTGNNEVRAVDPVSGIISLYAGGGSVCAAPYDLAIDSEGDGCAATQATLSFPSGLAADEYGNLYISDTGNNLIRVVDVRTGTINLYAGLISGNALCTTAANPDNYGDGCPFNQASFSSPKGLALDSSGDLFIADTGNNLIRELSSSTGVAAKVAGNGQSVFTGDGGLATAASLSAPSAVKVDADGDLYIADSGNDAVRFVAAASGDISTLLGQGGTSGSAGGTGDATQLEFASPSGIAVDSLGNVYVSDTGNNRIIEDNRNLGILAFGRENIGSTTPEQTATITNVGNQPLIFNGSPYSVTGSTSSFSIDTTPSTTCSGNGIAASANCTLAGSFAPGGTSTYTDNISINSNAVNQSALLQLTGTGVLLTTTTTTLVQTAPTGAISYGQQATFTATVAPTSGNGSPTGGITFSIDGKNQPQAVPLSGDGTATLTISLPVGSHTIRATYSGDDTYATSNDSVSAPVSLAGTTTTLSISPSTQIQLQPVTFTAQVTSDTNGIPTGSVNFMSGTTVIGTKTLDATGSASYTTSSLAIATYSVTAVYSSDPNYATSSSQPVTLTVSPIPPGFTATVSSSTLTVPQGGTVQTPITLTAAGGITGNVTFSCSGLPANTACTFFPTVINLPTLTPAVDCPPYATTALVICTAVTFTTNVPPVALSQLNKPMSGNSARILSAAVFFPALLLGIGLFDRKKRRLSMMVLSLVFFTGFALLSGCSSNATQVPGQLTPAGTSHVVITMSGPDGITQTLPITLIVLAGTPVTAQVDYPKTGATPSFKPANALASAVFGTQFSLR